MRVKTLNYLFKNLVKLLSWDSSLSFFIDDERNELVIVSSSIFCSSMFDDLTEFCHGHNLRFYVSTIIEADSCDKLVCYVKSNFVVEK